MNAARTIIIDSIPRPIYYYEYLDKDSLRLVLDKREAIIIRRDALVNLRHKIPDAIRCLTRDECISRFCSHRRNWPEFRNLSGNKKREYARKAEKFVESQRIRKASYGNSASNISNVRIESDPYTKGDREYVQANHSESALAAENLELKRKAEMNDEDIKRTALHVLEKMESPEVVRAWQKYTSGLSMKAVALKILRPDKTGRRIPISESTVRRLLMSAEEKVGCKVIREHGGAAHSGNTNRHNKKTRNIEHGPPGVNDD